MLQLNKIRTQGGIIMQAFQGYFDQGRFIPLDTTIIPERKKVIVTVLDEAIFAPKDNSERVFAALDHLQKIFADGKISSRKFMDQKQAEKELER